MDNSRLSRLVISAAMASLLFVRAAPAALAEEPPDVDELKAGMQARLADVRQGLLRYTITHRALPKKFLEDPQEFQRMLDMFIQRYLSPSQRTLSIQNELAQRTGQPRPKKRKLSAAKKEKLHAQVTRIKLGSQFTEEVIHAWDGNRGRQERKKIYDPATYHKPALERDHTWTVYDGKRQVIFDDRSSDESPSAVMFIAQKEWVPRLDRIMRTPTLRYRDTLQGYELVVEESETRFDKTAWWVSTKQGKPTYRALISPEHAYMILEFEHLDSDGSVRGRTEVKSITESNGVHFPTKVVTLEYSEQGWPSGEKHLAREEIIEVHEVALNTPPDEKLFEATLPDGTNVTDQTRGPRIHYVVSQKLYNPDEVAELLEETELEEPPAVEASPEAEKPAAPPAPPIAEAAPPAAPAAEEEAGGSGWLLFAIAAALIVLVALALLLRRRRGGHSG